MALTPVTMTGASKYNLKAAWTAFNQLITDLASTATGKGASCIGVYDSAGNFTATNVETALAEVYTDHAPALAMSIIFAEKSATTTGLTWGYEGGTLRNDNVITTVAAGTVSLTDDTTNYVEVTAAGVVYVVSSAFTEGRIPIRTVVTSGGVQTASTDKRGWLAVWPVISNLVQNLKVTANATVNILDLFEKISGSDPSTTYPIRVAIPDGTGLTWRTRSASNLSGTGSFTLANAGGYWNLPSLDGSFYDAFVYAIWSAADSKFVWGMTTWSDLITVPAFLFDTTDLLVGDGAFSGGSTNWTFNTTPWTYSTNTMLKDGDGTNTLAHDTFAAVTGQRYKLTYTISAWSVGTVTPTLGGVAGTAVGADGTYTTYITATGTTGISFAGTNTSRFTIDSITISKDAGPFMLLEDSSTYTRVATDYCVPVAKVRLTYDTADTPDYTFSSSNIGIIHGEVSNPLPYTNTGAGGAIEFVLPHPVLGRKVRAIVNAAQYLKLIAPYGVTIRCLGNQSASGGYVRSNVVGNTIDLEGTGTTEYVTTGIGGAWTYDL
mgnify:FL=1